MAKKLKRENAYINLNAVKLLFQKVEEKINPQIKLSTYSSFKKLAREISHHSYPNLDYEYEADMIIQPKTLQRYWGTLKYGHNRRFSPSPMCLDRLAEFCEFRNWEDFLERNKGEYVKNILPYERNIIYIHDGIKFVKDIPIGEVLYFGSEIKYIALLRRSNDVQIVDYKNVFGFQSFIYMLIAGIEVIQDDKNSPSIRFLY